MFIQIAAKCSNIKAQHIAQAVTYCQKCICAKKINTVSATIKERNNSKHVDIVIRV